MKKEKTTELELAPSDYVVTTITGLTTNNNKAANKDGKLEAASFSRPTGICLVRNAKHHAIIVSDSGTNSLRKIYNGEVSTVTLKAEKEEDVFLHRPGGLYLGKTGEIFVADTDNHRIAIVKPDGYIKTLVGGYRDFSKPLRLCAPYDVIEEKNGLIISDTFNHKIRFFSVEEGKLSTLCGSLEGYADGTGEEAKFNKPMGITTDSKGNVYVCDTYNYKIRKVTPQGVVSTIAGSVKGHEDGPGKDAKFGRPTGIACAKNGYLYVTDNDPPCVRRISPTGNVTTITGKTMGNADGPADKSKFYVLGSICMDVNEDLYVADTYNHSIKKISLINEKE